MSLALHYCRVFWQARSNSPERQLLRYLMQILCIGVLFFNGIAPTCAQLEGYSLSQNLAFCLVGIALVLGTMVADAYQQLGYFWLFSMACLLIGLGF